MFTQTLNIVLISLHKNSLLSDNLGICAKMKIYIFNVIKNNILKIILENKRLAKTFTLLNILAAKRSAK